MSTPCLSPPSEGEIIESDSEKATTAIVSKKGNSVDRSFRTRLSVSRSPSPIRSPKRDRSRTESRSPYRENWAAKRTVEDDHYDRSRNDPRRFKVRYEDHPQGSRSKVHRSYRDLNRSDGEGRGFPYQEQDLSGQLPDKRPTVRSRSPMHGRRRRGGAREHHAGEQRDRHRREQGDRGYKESQSRLSREQSVSDMGYSPVVAAQLKREAETRINQIQLDISAGERGDSPIQYVSSSLGSSFADTNGDSGAGKHGIIFDKVMQPTSTQPTDEITLIEERRKRREAIKARHRGQATPLIVRSMALPATYVPSTPELMDVQKNIPAHGKLIANR